MNWEAATVLVRLFDCKVNEKMKPYCSRIVLAIFIAAIPVFWNCEDTTSSENPVPGQVILVQKSAEDDSVEKGIDAQYILGSQPPRDGIFIEWHPVEDKDLAAYVIRRSTVSDSTAFAVIGRVRRIAGKIDTSYVDDNVNVGTRYYYRVTAQDAENEGPISEPANYLLEEMCTLNAPTPTTPFDGTFQWQWPTIQPSQFIFRLLKEVIPNTPFELIFVQTFDNNFSPNQEWSLAELGVSALTPGRYQWRIDIMGNVPNSGSESDQVDFQVQ